MHHNIHHYVVNAQIRATPIKNFTMSLDHYQLWSRKRENSNFFALVVLCFSIIKFYQFCHFQKEILLCNYIILKDCSFAVLDSIHLSRRSISAVIYLKVVGIKNHPTILSYQTFGSKESYSFFTTEHLVVKNPICLNQTKYSVVKNVKTVPYILMGFQHGLTFFWSSFYVKLGQNWCKP